MIGRYASQIAILLRHLRAERALIATVVVVVCLTSLVMAAIPRLYTAMLDDELTYRMEQAPDQARNIQVSIPYRFAQDPGEDRLREKGDDYQAGLPDSIQPIISGNEYVIETPNLVALPGTEADPDFQRSLQLRILSNVNDRIQITSGRLPKPSGTIRLSEWRNIPGARGEPERQIFEAVISDPAAAEMAMHINELTRIIVTAGNAQALVNIVGTFNVIDPQADYWNGDTWLTEPVIFGFASDFNQILAGAVLISPDAYSTLFESYEGDFTYRWNYYVDPDALTTGNYRTVIAEARQLQFTTGPTDAILTGGHNRITLSNDLPRLLNDFALQTNVALTVIALSAVGLLVTGLAALALLAALIADRRRATIALIRGRGASAAQLF
ncbi:MAG TPA: hypothetical protein VFV93_16375, partial [Thermomicrobiales bacterium]|nr:hypothetical protein [Thermomicrobiales bacterium]